MDLKYFEDKLDILESDLRAYIKANRNYDGSVSAANGRYKALLSVYCSLPYEISQVKFDAMLNTVSFSDIEVCLSFIMDWVKNQIENAPEPPRIL